MPVVKPPEEDPNPWTIIPRGIGEVVTSVDDIVRGLWNIGDAVISDIATAGRGAIPGGSKGFGEPDAKYRIAEDVLIPMGLSMANTADTLNDLTYLGNLFTKGAKEANAEFGERLGELNRHPGEFVLEHVGNMALVGGVLGKAARAGAGTARARGAQTAASRLDAIADVSSGVIAHPYVSAYRKAKNSKTADLLRNPVAREKNKELWDEFRGRVSEQVADELGSIILRAEDPRGQWNAAVDNYIDAATNRGNPEYFSENLTEQTGKFDLRSMLNKLQVDTPSGPVNTGLVGLMHNLRKNNEFDADKFVEFREIIEGNGGNGFDDYIDVEMDYLGNMRIVDGRHRFLAAADYWTGRANARGHINLQPGDSSIKVRIRPAKGSGGHFAPWGLRPDNPNSKYLEAKDQLKAAEQNLIEHGYTPKWLVRQVGDPSPRKFDISEVEPEALTAVADFAEWPWHTASMGFNPSTKHLNDFSVDVFFRRTQSGISTPEVVDWDGKLTELEQGFEAGQIVAKFTDANGNLGGFMAVSLGNYSDINLAVRPDLRGQGIATRLAGTLIDRGVNFENIMKNAGNITNSEDGAAFTAAMLDKARESGGQQGLLESLKNERFTAPKLDNSKVVNADELLESDSAYDIQRALELLEQHPDGEVVIGDHVYNRDHISDIQNYYEELLDAENNPDSLGALPLEEGWMPEEAPRVYSPSVDQGVDSQTRRILDNMRDEIQSTQEIVEQGLADTSLANNDNGQRLIDTLRRLHDEEEGSVYVGPWKRPGTHGPLNYLANEVGLQLNKVRDSGPYKTAFGEGSVARKIVADMRQKIIEAERLVREKYDPSRTERLFQRDIDNLEKINPNAALVLGPSLRTADTGPRTAPRRAAEVATGKRTVGATESPADQLHNLRIMFDWARNQNMPFDEAWATIAPNVDPLSAHLMALNLVEKANHLPADSLTRRLGAYITMDRFSEVNRKAQEALSDAGADLPSDVGTRFRIPDEDLQVSIDTLSPEDQALFYKAAEEYRRSILDREYGLTQAGLIPENGTRVGLRPDEPTQFSLELEDLTLTPKMRKKVEKLEKAEAKARKDIKRTQKKISTLQQPAAIQRHTARLTKQKLELLDVQGKLAKAEDAARTALTSAPASARDLLTYTRKVATEQAKALRDLAKAGYGDPQVLKNLADELEAAPKSLEELNNADVYLAYLKDTASANSRDAFGPTLNRAIDTKPPGGLKRRGVDTSIDYDPDLRKRLYLQEAEFQSWFLKRQADELVKTQRLARSGRDWLEENDYDVDNMTPGQQQQVLEKHLGLTVYQPDQLFTTARKPAVHNPPGDALWISPYAARSIAKAIEKPGGGELFFGQGIVDPITNTWKTFVLPLRLAWQVNNVAGNAFLTMFAGKVSPADYRKLSGASWKAVRDWNRGINSEIQVPIDDSMRANLKKEQALPSTSPDRVLQIDLWLNQGYVGISNEVLGEISSSGLTRGDFAFLNNSTFMREVAPNQNVLRQMGLTTGGATPVKPGGVRDRARNLRNTGSEGVAKLRHLNETMDNFHRTLVYIDAVKKGGDHSQAMAQVVKTLGDYKKLNRVERKYVKRIYPFYPWMKHIAGVTVNMLRPENITRTIIFAHLMDIMAEPNEWEAMLPDYASGNIYMGMDEESGLPEFLSVRGLNPFLDVFDPVSQPNARGFLRSAHPIISAGGEQLFGVSNLTGRPFSSPYDGPNGMTRRPPVSEQFVRSIPQLKAGRDVYRDLRGLPLTRYGTGEPAFFPGAEDGRSGANSVQQLFGYNVKPLDVRNIEQRSKMQDYQNELKKRQHEARESKLPSLFGGD